MERRLKDTYNEGQLTNKLPNPDVAKELLQVMCPPILYDQAMIENNANRVSVEEININELKAAIENKKDTGKGAHNISYSIIKNLTRIGTI